MFGPMQLWFEGWRFAADVQSVVAMRLMRLAGHDAVAAREATRMVTEKMAAMAEAQVAAATALMGGRGVDVAMQRAYVPYRRRVRANRRRLG